MTEAHEPAYQGWALIELFGHRKTAGIVSEVDIAGARMLRIDTPGADGETVVTQFYGGGAIYAITPCTEAVARQTLAKAWSLPEPVALALEQRALPAPDRRHEHAEDVDFEVGDELGEEF